MIELMQSDASERCLIRKQNNDVHVTRRTQGNRLRSEMKFQVRFSTASFSTEHRCSSFSDIIAHGDARYLEHSLLGSARHIVSTRTFFILICSLVQAYILDHSGSWHALILSITQKPTPRASDLDLDAICRGILLDLFRLPFCPQCTASIDTGVNSGYSQPTDLPGYTATVL